MGTTTHHHRPIAVTAIEPWFGCVAPDVAHSELTHGNAIVRDTCAVCGAVRLTEANAGSSTVGPWVESDEYDYGYD